MIAATGCAADSEKGKAVVAASTSLAAPTSSTVVTPAIQLPKTTVQQPVPPSPAPAPPPPAQPAPAARAPMPNVVCMNLQAAQNKIQESGVWYSRSTDATGKGRMQVLDANWIVVSQTPAPGVSIGEGDAVLSVVKLGERNPC
ncbi:hypothetical protein AB0M22_12565 [Nocardia sp. NPDC051756]|uniref:PASTA domain-containing protein n=1 Tax=Nocardia sp. NPDC051756 TaxID=3154751 RepID=UPI00343F719A